MIHQTLQPGKGLTARPVAPGRAPDLASAGSSSPAHPIRPPAPEENQPGHPPKTGSRALPPPPSDQRRRESSRAIAPSRHLAISPPRHLAISPSRHLATEGGTNEPAGSKRELFAGTCFLADRQDDDGPTARNVTRNQDGSEVAVAVLLSRTRRGGLAAVPLPWRPCRRGLAVAVLPWRSCRRGLASVEAICLHFTDISRIRPRAASGPDAMASSRAINQRVGDAHEHPEIPKP